MPTGEFGIRGHDAEFLLPREDPLPKHVPTVVEPSPVPLGPLLRNVVRSVCGAGGEVQEERLVGCEDLLLPHPRDRLVGQVLGEVVALFRGAPRLHPAGALVQVGYHWSVSPPRKP